MTETPWADYLDERCHAQLGCSYEDAWGLYPKEVTAITEEVLVQRWPHLRGTFS